jgi:2-polyprenyl-6-methoxyphenol hydroxylase-like FAD-dependent oxidoreductase
VPAEPPKRRSRTTDRHRQADGRTAHAHHFQRYDMEDAKTLSSPSSVTFSPDLSLQYVFQEDDQVCETVTLEAFANDEMLRPSHFSLADDDEPPVLVDCVSDHRGPDDVVPLSGSSWGGRTVIVVGAGVAGLLAGFALLPEATKLVVLEQDEDLGAAQSSHLDFLSLDGGSLIESIVPGFIAEFERAGAVKIDANRWIHTSEMVRLVLRTLLLKRHGGIQIVSGARVTKLHVEVVGDRRQAMGVVLADNSALHANLVICATGHDSNVRGWLQSLELNAPAFLAAECKVSFCMVAIRDAPKDIPSHDDVLVLPAASGITYISCCAPSPGDARQRLSSFVESNLPSISLHHLDVQEASFEKRCHHRFEDVCRVVQGVAIVGDALSLQDPRSDLGICVAALQAQVLAKCNTVTYGVLCDRAQEKCSLLAWRVFASSRLVDSPEIKTPMGILNNALTRLSTTLGYRNAWIRTILSHPT